MRLHQVTYLDGLTALRRYVASRDGTLSPHTVDGLMHLNPSTPNRI
jgi:hypothetical protein